MGHHREEDVRARAHRIWEEEGRPEGRDLDHWLRAEEELRLAGVEEGGTVDETPVPQPEQDEDSISDGNDDAGSVLPWGGSRPAS